MTLKEQNRLILPKLKRLARRWGGRIEQLSEEAHRRHDAISHAPFTSYDLGMDWEKKIVYYVPDDRLHWADVIHEMGHVFACVDPPDESAEFSFFGWEHVVAEQVGGNYDEWCKAQKDYQLDDGFTEGARQWGYVSPEERKRVLENRIEEGMQLGIISKQRKARAIR